MQLKRRPRVNANLQVVVVGCSDDLCSPIWAVREYLLSHGIVTEIPDSNIHPIRNAGGIFTAEVMWETEQEISIIREHLFRQTGFLVEKKGATYVFITGHNPCAGCNSINVDVAAQQKRAVSDAHESANRFNVRAIAMFEEHVHGSGDGHYAVLEEFGNDKIVPVAVAA